MVFANAGTAEFTPFLDPEFQSESVEPPAEPEYPLLDLNLRATLNTVKLAWSKMRNQPKGGRIVVTTSSTVFSPWAMLPVYVASKSAVCCPFSFIIYLRLMHVNDEKKVC